METQETIENLDDLDPQLFEESEEQEPEEEATIEIKGQPVKLSDVEAIWDNYQNDSKWQTTNTQKAQEIAAEKARLEQEKQQVEQLRRDAELLLNRSYQPQTNIQTQQSVEQQDKYFGLSADEFEDLTPTEKLILKNQYEQSQAWRTFQAENEKKEFWQQTQAEHNRLKGLYPEYDGSTIERAIIQGRNQFEDVHLAETLKRIKQGDPNTIKSLIPEAVLNDIRMETRKQLIEELRRKDQARKKLATPQPEKGGLGKIPDSTPVGKKTYRDIRNDVLQTLNDEKISLFQ